MFLFKKKKVNNSIIENTEKTNSLVDESIQFIDGQNLDDAIKNLENNVFNNRKLGKPFSMLMNLYNEKLKIARLNKDDSEINVYLEKIDKLMQVSKDIVRGK